MEFSVIPAKAGIQAYPKHSLGELWIPAFAGMTFFLYWTFKAFRQLP